MSDRFELLGMLGRGGTATVHLANDALRGHQVALKVVHPHLADDPAVRRRLRREVGAASLIQHEAALVPYDLHEVDGSLALSMPWHPGETLAERVSRRGALPAGDVHVLAVRLAGALSASHRAGVLHRDVTAANVLLEEASDAVLSDFGLARVTKIGTQATTGLLGTAGYAAPEVYSGSRADPRSDLYGLGAVLYLAATGLPAFDPAQPMAALKAQLDDGYTPVRELAPKVPESLATLIESLLRANPDQRPAGATDVIDILEGRQQATARSPRPTTSLTLPAGDWTVLIVERESDQLRRGKLRRALRGKRRRPTIDDHIADFGRSIAEGLRSMVGWPPESGEISPEQMLAEAVADEGGLPAGGLEPNVAMLDKRFRLIEHTDEATARRLAERAKDAGFKTEVHAVRTLPDWQIQASQFWWVAIFPLLAFTRGVPGNLQPMAWIAFGLAVAAAATWGNRAGVQKKLAGRAIAFRRGTATSLPSAQATTESDSPREGQRLLARAVEVLDGLDATIAEDDHLSEPAKIDLRSTSKRLRASARDLAKRHDALSDTLAQHGSATDEVSGLAARLARLDTLARSGRPIDAAERRSVESALTQHTADEAAAEKVESALIATQAQLIELCSTASRVRREIVQHGPRHSADDAVRLLQRQADAAERARREASQQRS